MTDNPNYFEGYTRSWIDTYRDPLPWDNLGYLKYEEWIVNPYHNVSSEDNRYSQTWDEVYSDIILGANSLKTLSFEFPLEDLHVDTKRLLYGFQLSEHDCEIKAETGDCKHWVPDTKGEK